MNKNNTSSRDQNWHNNLRYEVLKDKETRVEYELFRDKLEKELKIKKDSRKINSK